MPGWAFFATKHRRQVTGGSEFGGVAWKIAWETKKSFKIPVFFAYRPCSGSNDG
jgi:hypothetical protein